VSEGRWRITVTAPDWGEDHLTLDAIVAYVDDELGPGPYTRATRHVAHCDECAAQVVAQTQARAALRTAAGPQPPSALLSALRSIPQHADLPAPPADLAISEDGEFLYRAEPDNQPARSRRSAPPRSGIRARSMSLPTGALAVTTEVRAPEPQIEDAVADAPEQGRRMPVQRRIRLGTGVAMSGLALGALAFGVTSASPTVPAPPAARGVLGGPVLGGVLGGPVLSPAGLVDARLRLGAAGNPETPVNGLRDMPRAVGSLRSLW
jgi:anti-sigma factor RsiW